MSENYQHLLIIANRMSLVVLAAIACVAFGGYTPNTAPVSGFTLLKSSNASSYYQIEAPTSDYGIPVYLVDLKGSFVEVYYSLIEFHFPILFVVQTVADVCFC